MILAQMAAAASSSASAASSFIVFSFLLLLHGSCSAQLSTSFYSTSCPNLSYIINSVVDPAVGADNRMAASLLRLHFHDCFVHGCDGSVLLDDTSSFVGEKTAAPNNNSLRGFDVIDNIKSAVEAQCPNTVSCADILTLAARESVMLLGGPYWDVDLGRRDATTASFSTANTDLPSPSSNLATLISKFSNKGLSAKDMIALSGAHTIGKARCVSFRSRIYNDTNIDSGFASARQSGCASAAGATDNSLASLDLQTPTGFDNKFYINLIGKKGLLHSDQELYNNGSADAQVATYAGSTGEFFDDFADAMVKMGDISPLTGSSGEIRKNCRVVN